jgi:hypothetical protein
MKRSLFLKTLPLAVTTLVACGSAHAGLVNDVPSCYAATHIQPDAHPYDKLVYILVDQTVALDPALEQSVVDNSLRMLQPGSKFVIAEFSAFSQGRYLTVLHTGIIERPLDASRVNSTSIRAAKDLDQCLGQQGGFARTMVARTLAEVMKASTSSLDQSDILMALNTVSAAVAADPAQRKTVFAATDGLENSSLTSFYARGSVRDINPSNEMARAVNAHLLGDFGGALVYILGGAVMPPATLGTKAQRDGYRDPRTLSDLSQFWHNYFGRSNAHLVEFGEPALVEPVSY